MANGIKNTDMHFFFWAETANRTQSPHFEYFGGIKKW